MLELEMKITIEIDDLNYIEVSKNKWDSCYPEWKEFLNSCSKNNSDSAVKSIFEDTVDVLNCCIQHIEEKEYDKIIEENKRLREILKMKEILK